MKKTIWAHVSIELDWCDDEEILMNYTNQVLVEEEIGRASCRERVSSPV